MTLNRRTFIGGVLASAVSMDKFFTKVIVAEKGIRQAEGIGLRFGTSVQNKYVHGLLLSLITYYNIFLTYF